MLHTAHYTIKTEGGEIALLFNSFCFRTYCERKGIELEELHQGIRNGSAYKTKDVPDLLLMAHETWCLYNKQPFSATIIEACDWIDSLGGFNSTELIKIYQVFVAKLLNIDPAKFQVLWNKKEAEEETEDGEKNDPALQAEGS